MNDKKINLIKRKHALRRLLQSFTGRTIYSNYEMGLDKDAPRPKPDSFEELESERVRHTLRRVIALEKNNDNP